MVSPATRKLIAERLAAERGRRDKDAPFRVALTYPSPYRVGMSSLGFQRIYGLLQQTPGIAAERVFLADGADKPSGRVTEAPVAYESLRPLGDFPLIAASVAYELEIAGLVKLLDAANIPALAEARGEGDPFVLAGGPLTFSNPVPLFPFVDAVVLGEADGLTAEVAGIVRDAGSRSAALQALAAHPHVAVPSVRPGDLPTLAQCDDALLPAHSAIRTPNTELSDMFLIETERGCSRGCSYCVMRRSTNGGMRVVPKETVLDRIPTDATRVGLVGAAVSDHPRIVDIVSALAERGSTVGLSSLRPDRLKEPFVEALARAGYRTLTTALDGASQRLRDGIERRGREPHYENAAALAKRYGMKRLKLYLMIGLPEETDADIDECATFVSELSRQIPVALGVAPFCAKRRTPLDGAPFAGMDVVARRLSRLRRGLAGRADVRAASARWAWVEYVLAQGAEPEGRALADAVRAGGRFSDYRAAFERLGWRVDGPTLPPRGGVVATVERPLVRLRTSG